MQLLVRDWTSQEGAFLRDTDFLLSVKWLTVGAAPGLPLATVVQFVAYGGVA
ncbi:hypothetical protein SAMN06269250_3812 [Spirosoma fluviale]|uniref:Uncharacterized protein n=1 Tax=Spirosoma fluviale TaxID=1597977 RepID=A0A286G990_9BACT|nr:hypothetical protein SAMN06269250_3812 [Spirosoma fluviale]